MSPGPIISNSSPLIALDRIARLDLLERLFGRIVIPPAVRTEISPRLMLPAWIDEQPLRQPLDPRVMSASVGPGEREVIALALETSASQVLVDDRPARRLAQSLGLSIVGTLGVLAAAKRRGELLEIRSSLDALLAQGFRISSSLYVRMLSDAGEAP